MNNNILYNKQDVYLDKLNNNLNNLKKSSSEINKLLDQQNLLIDDCIDDSYDKLNDSNSKIVNITKNKSICNIL